MHEDVYAEGGEYLSLCVWANLGFNVELIRKYNEPENKSYDEVLGDTFCVVIKSKATQRQSWHVPPRGL